MLIDEIQDPFDDPLMMVFPHMDTLIDSWAFYHMKAVSDDDSWGDTSTTTNGAAVWFNTVFFDTGYVQDTVSLDSFHIDSIWRDDLGDNDCVESIVEVLPEPLTQVPRIFGVDTVMQTVVPYSFETYLACVDSGAPPYLTTNVTLYWIVGAYDSEGVWREDHVMTVPFDDHRQLGAYWKDLTSYGWKYRGWVVSSVINDVNAGIGVISPPAWTDYNTDHDSIIRGIDGGLLSTGTFVSLDEPDEGNPYCGSQHGVPPFPGEDFLHVPGATTSEVQLVPGGGVSTGTIFIAMHPTNAVTDTTNFPLIVCTAELPADREQVTAFNQGYFTDYWNPYDYSMTPQAIIDLPANQQVEPHPQGFPQIRVEFERR